MIFKNIPKIIYQTWFKKELPTPIQSSIDNMMALNTGYKYQIFDDIDMRNFIKTNYDKNILKCFDSLKIGAAKADLWRYLILYKTGGIYIDVDSTIVGKLDDLIKNEACAVISRETNYNKFVQWCLVFTPEHPLLKICIDKCIANIQSGSIMDVTELTGPVVYSDSIREYFNDINIYSKSDLEINSNKLKTGVKIIDYDYKNYANFIHPNKDLLYQDKLHWRDEQELILNKN